jgi:hypothetical protein
MAVRIGFAIQVLLSIFPYSSTETDPSRQSPLQGTPKLPSNTAHIIQGNETIFCGLSICLFESIWSLLF